MKNTEYDIACPEIKSKVLVVGVYLANTQNSVEHVVCELFKTKKYAVKQKWVAINGKAPSRAVQQVTIKRVNGFIPKFVLLNRLLSDECLEQYDYVLLCDDDIRFCPEFLDTFLGMQCKFDFALAQPARTHNSYIDHPLVEQVDGLCARRTRFVEIGPVVSIRRDILPHLFPFDERTPMGWGLDFVWPVIVERFALRMGIVDLTPVDHSMRKPVDNYSYNTARAQMDSYLLENTHLSQQEAFCVLEQYLNIPGENTL